MAGSVTTKAEEYANLLTAMANILVEPMLCTRPGYGAPGFAHCAACCGGTGVIVTCDEDQAILDASEALHRAACAVYNPRPT